MNDEMKPLYEKVIGKYKVKILPSKCIAAASCIAISPEVFKLSEQNIAEIIAGGVDDADNILLAAQSCPTGAIELYEGDKLVWPM